MMSLLAIARTNRRAVGWGQIPSVYLRLVAMGRLGLTGRTFSASAISQKSRAEPLRSPVVLQKVEKFHIELWSVIVLVPFSGSTHGS